MIIIKKKNNRNSYDNRSQYNYSIEFKHRILIEEECHCHICQPMPSLIFYAIFLNFVSLFYVKRHFQIQDD